MVGHVRDDIPTGAREALAEILTCDANLPVIISTKVGNPERIVDLVKNGAFDYVLEPKDPASPEELALYAERFEHALRKAVHWRSIFKENRKLRRALAVKDLPSEIIARSEPMLKVLDLVKKVAPTSATVLITGESGTGKECVARRVHELSHVRDQAFIAVNCGSMNDQLLASEIFGHVKGSFTGAHADRPGFLREAGKGTLFLDEIGTVSQAFQIMLLRVLEQRTARPVGGSANQPVNARFIAAANQNIQSMVQEGTFREDLWYRLSVFHIHLPPLRERVEDIPVLALHFLNRACETFGKTISSIEPAALRRLEAHDWPGNVRQLRNVMDRASIVCDGNRISIGDLELGKRSTPVSMTGTTEVSDLSYDRTMQRCERRILSQAMAEAKGNITKAAELLGIKRTTLHYRMKLLKIPLGRRESD